MGTWEFTLLFPVLSMSLKKFIIKSFSKGIIKLICDVGRRRVFFFGRGCTWRARVVKLVEVGEDRQLSVSWSRCCLNGHVSFA